MISMFIYKYYHIGFDIVANRILETLERYASRYDPRYQKVYWITGEAGGGSVANLLAQKMIKKCGNQHIYCYTFQALNTINCNNIPAVQRISNEPYGSIFNLYNDDNELIKLYSNDNNFYKYGINKHVAVSSSDEYIVLWQNATGEKYNKTTKNNNAEKFKEWLSESEEDMVSGFSNTNLANIFVNAIKETIIKFTAYFKSIGRSHISTSNAYENPIEQEIYDNTSKIVSASSDILYIQSGGEISGIIKAIGRKQDQKGTSVNGYNAGDNYIYDSRDGNPFGRYKDELREKDNQYLYPYNSNLEPAVKIVMVGFRFSNYTISSNYKERDINFVKFWNQNDNGKLSKYRIGDYNGKTKFTYEKSSEHFNDFINSFPTPTVEGSAGRIKNINGMYIIDERILAAFPAALAGEGDYQYESFLNDMHRVSSYKKPIKWENNKYAYSERMSQKDDGSYESTGNGKYIGGDDIFKLVDCVFEDSEGRQFVVPFIVIDAKLLHLLPNMYDAQPNQFLSDGTSKVGMMSHLTDNRYGQVIEIATGSDINTKTIEQLEKDKKIYTYYEVRNLLENKEEIIDKNRYDNLNGTDYYKPDPPHKLIYFDKSVPREEVTISPIEVLTDGRSLEDYQINEIIFGDRNKYKLISMRIYKNESSRVDTRYSPDRTEYGTAGLTTLTSKVALQNGTPTESVWHRYKRIIDEINTNEKRNQIRSDGYSGILEFFNAGKFDKIVDY